MNYLEAMEFLHDLTKFGFNFGLGRIEKLLELLGNPHQSFPVVHIGGTNGKGSTAAILTAILEAAGKKTAVYSSPHLTTYRERIMVDGQMITETEIAGLLTEIRPHLENMVLAGHEHPTEFEVLTAAALLYFSRRQVDLAVMEVGLGGAIDSTNVVKSMVSVITNVGMDHMDYLGNSLKEITEVKAGIIKEKVPLVTAADKPEVLNVLTEVCSRNQSSMTRVGVDVTYQFLGQSLEGQEFTVNTRTTSYTNLKLTLLGRHQAVNAATAVAVVEELRQQGISVTDEAVYQGIAAARWPARLELIAGTPPVLVDAAHNYDGAVALAAALKQYFPAQKLVLLIGMLADKERERVMAILAPLAETVVITRPNSPRAGQWQQMAVEAQKYAEDVVVEESPIKALDYALTAAGNEGMLCVTGSFYMMAEVRQEIIRRRQD